MLFFREIKNNLFLYKEKTLILIRLYKIIKIKKLHR